MSKLKSKRILIVALLLAMAVITNACGDPDKNAAPVTPTSPTNPPTVTAVTPPSGSTLVCPNTAVITATFSKAMNPATINTTTFTVTSGSSPVAGTVTYVASTNVATFTPTAALASSSSFTATITTGATDTFGNTLAANFPWTFTTS